MVASAALTFNPPPDRVPAVVSDLFSPLYSLRDVADRHDTTCHALTLWMARPDIAASLESFGELAAFRVRTLATAALPAAVRVLESICRDFTPTPGMRSPPATESRDSTAPSLPISPAPAASPPDPTLQQRARETARRAATLLLRLARLMPAPLKAPPCGRGWGGADARAASPTTPGMSAANPGIKQPAAPPNPHASTVSAPHRPGGEPRFHRDEPAAVFTQSAQPDVPHPVQPLFRSDLPLPTSHFAPPSRPSPATLASLAGAASTAIPP